MAIKYQPLNMLSHHIDYNDQQADIQDILRGGTVGDMWPLALH